VPARTLDELVKWAAAQPGKAAYASFSPGTPSHFLGFQLNQRFRLDMAHVPYKGSGPQEHEHSCRHQRVRIQGMERNILS